MLAKISTLTAQAKGKFEQRHDPALIARLTDISTRASDYEGENGEPAVYCRIQYFEKYNEDVKEKLLAALGRVLERELAEGGIPAHAQRPGEITLLLLKSEAQTLKKVALRPELSLYRSEAQTDAGFDGPAVNF